MAVVPWVSALTAAAILALQLVLMITVVRARAARDTIFGTGDAHVEQAARVHGNLAENAGIFVAALALLELLAAPRVLVAALGIGFVVVRVVHAVGLSRSTGVTAARFVGASGTLLLGVVLVATLVGYALAHL